MGVPSTASTLSKFSLHQILDLNEKGKNSSLVKVFCSHISIQVSISNLTAIFFVCVSLIPATHLVC